MLDPSVCAQKKVPEGDSTTGNMMTATTLRYDDDACGANYTPKTWQAIVADHGSYKITAIKVSTGFTGGTDLTAFLTKLAADHKTFSFGS